MRRLIPLAALAALSLGACSPPVSGFCASARPLYLASPASADRLLADDPDLAAAIIAHNETGAAECGWTPPGKD